MTRNFALRSLWNAPFVLFALVWLLIAGVPFYFMTISGFKERFEMMRGSVFAFPVEPTLANFQDILTSGTFFRYLGNSVLVVSLSIAIILALSSMAAYVFARIPFRLNKPLFGLIVAGLVIPLHVTLIPVYFLTRTLGLYDTIWALIGPYVAFSLPLSIFILTEFIRQIPKDLEDAARIDGCGPMNTFWRIILPLSTPGLATIAIYNAVALWNEFVFAFVLITSPEYRPLPLAIWEYQGQYSMNVPAIMGVLTLSALPLILVYIVAQERVVKGMMAGALK